MLRQTVQYGWTTAMQQGTVQLGKIAIQAVVNTMGVNAMAAFAAASRVDDFAYTPQQNIGHAMTTLMAQNRGAGKAERVRQGFFAGMRIEAVYGLAIMAVCFFGAEPIMRLFADEPEVIALGVRFLRLVSLLYLLPSATNGIQGGFRGVGRLQVTLNSSLLNMGLPRGGAAAGHPQQQPAEHGRPGSRGGAVRPGVPHGHRGVALELRGGLAVYAGIRAAAAVQAAERKRVLTPHTYSIPRQAQRPAGDFILFYCFLLKCLNLLPAAQANFSRIVLIGAGLLKGILAAGAFDCNGFIAFFKHRKLSSLSKRIFANFFQVAIQRNCLQRCTVYKCPPRIRDYTIELASSNSYNGYILSFQIC